MRATEPSVPPERACPQAEERNNKMLFVKQKNVYKA